MPVPARAPSTAPRSLWSRDNWYRDTVFVSGTYLRDIAVVLFRATATQAERQAAVELVHGKVVGGHPLAEGSDGYYYVCVPGTDYPRPLIRALQQLQALPQVLSATPEFVDNALRF